MANFVKLFNINMSEAHENHFTGPLKSAKSYYIELYRTCGGMLVKNYIEQGYLMKTMVIYTNLRNKKIH